MSVTAMPAAAAPLTESSDPSDCAALLPGNTCPRETPFSRQPETFDPILGPTYFGPAAAFFGGRA